MPADPIKGLHKVTRRLAGGETKIYLYAWKGGPRLSGAPGSPAFRAAYAAAVQSRRRAPTEGKLAGLAGEFRASPEFAYMADSTRAEWSRMLDLIQDSTSTLAIGDVPVEALADFRVKKCQTASNRDPLSAPNRDPFIPGVCSRVAA